MSGIYQNWSADSPGGLNESTAAIREGLAQAVSAVAVTQLETEAFLVEHGAAVIPGHSPVNQPGRQGDPDLERDAADYG